MSVRKGRGNKPREVEHDDDEELSEEERAEKARLEAQRRADARTVHVKKAEQTEQKVEEAAEARGIAPQVVIERLEFDLPALTGIRVTVPPSAPVTEDDVDVRLNQLRHQVAAATPVGFGARVERGDQVELDVMGYQDSDLFLTLVHEWMFVDDNPQLPGFFDEVAGMFVGEEKAFSVDLPDDYVDPELRGQTVAFAVKVHSARRPQLPELDAAFWQMLGVSGEQEGRDAIRGDLIKTRADELVEHAKEIVIEEIMKRAQVEVDDAVIDQALNELWRHQEGDHLASQNTSLEKQQEARERFMADDALRDEVRRSFFERALLDKVIAEQELNEDPGEVLKLMLELVNNTSLSTNRVHEALTGGFGWDDAMHARLQDLRAMDWILKQVKVEFSA